MKSWVLEEYLLTTTLPDQTNSLLNNQIYSYLQIIASFSPYKEIFSLQQTETITENNIWTQNRDKMIMGSPGPTDTFTAQLLYPRLRKYHRRRRRMMLKYRGQEICFEIENPRNDREATSMVLQEHGFQNKTWTKTPPIDMVRPKRKLSWSHP